MNYRDTPQRKEPKDSGTTVKVGALKVTVTPLKPDWDTSNIRLRFETDSPMLLKYDQHDDGDRQPSVADKLVTIVEDTLTQAGMNIRDDIPRTPGETAKRGLDKAASTRVMHNYENNPDAIIRVQQGYFKPESGGFDQAFAASKIIHILTQIGEQIKAPGTPTSTREVVDGLYEAIDVMQNSAEGALEGSDASVRKVKPPKKLHQILAEAVAKTLPERFFETVERKSAIEEIVQSTLGENGHERWRRTLNPNLQGTDEDPLRDAVDSVLKSHIKRDIADSLRMLLDGEVCDALNNGMKGRGA